ncbi:hypothetical protein GCM10022243_39810 [Saccharothrix violaceirubra]|uniref:Putative PurR-regulated permease PerM n=1 Tax=Saccharothrix violaceirubra TaxID=413306 RepID=A0A7W7T0B2_9PSEU|nr:hypothetical protein [Saccharothrix violaceirubra]MBB4964236.1 putative PurR-regulated permease PerM [Saccharothrix violaceirubra]
MPSERAYRVPVRTILATIGLTLATVVARVSVTHVQRVLVWMLIAVVFTVALYPTVNWPQTVSAGTAARRRHWPCSSWSS